jgi:hypothetical protein
MTHPKRLPKLYLPTYDGELDVSMSGRVTAYVHRLPEDNDVAYAPAPATCATCKFFEKSKVYAGMICRWGTGVRQDGSGYCHNHPANQRATEGTKG